MPQSVISEQTTRTPETLANKGIPGQNYDKNIFHLPRHSSSTMMQGFAKWGRVRHKMAENCINTTVSTTKAHG
ncbi:hypothetical protein DWZ43_09140 [Ruminococcus sp. AF32-2AC]|nr:hypothetical protein DWZ43_09140 [Ruminococcus sp. AF32-2AC]